MAWTTAIAGWLSGGRAARTRTAQVVAAYEHWLASEHPRLWREYGDRLLAGVTPATLADRIATCDRLVARHGG